MTGMIIPPELGSKLWKHQADAILFSLKRLRQNGDTSRVLVRMPTGTGKTGVIAVLSIVLPPEEGWTLVLTPWKNLCEQMISDLQERFWGPPINWAPPKRKTIERLFPCTLDRIVNSSEKQLVLVATFATLITIFKKNRSGYQILAERISQVLVDECHYEPAVEWGQAVKNIKKPTLLLTATPYRNDLKLFRVGEKDVYHYTHEQAIADGIIRDIYIRSLGVPEPTSSQLESWCKAFADFWQSPEKENIHKAPRAIICCARMATVELVTALLRKQGINALGIHERFSSRRERWLVQDTPKPKEVENDVWVHQNKLTEGLDDNRFCVLAVLNPIKNDRKLIQQIGRVLRPVAENIGSVKKAGHALILHSEGLKIPRSWKNYREFEVQEDIIQSERFSKYYQTLLEKQPEMEYFDGQFRRRFQPRNKDIVAQIRLQSSVVIRKIGRSFQLDEFSDFTSDFLLLQDRILLGPNDGPIIGPNNSVLWVYAKIGNSRLLMEQAQYEVRLGALAAVIHDNLLFIVDTEGTYPSEYLSQHSYKLSQDELARIFEKNVVPKQTSLKNAWPVGSAIRHSSVSADDLASTPAQLTDAVFFCSAIRASSQNKGAAGYRRRHYVSFSRCRISEDIRSIERDSFSLNELVEWTQELAMLINNEKRKAPDFFRRYLSPIAAPQNVTPKYLIFNLIEGDAELLNGEGQPVELIESIVEVQSGKESLDGSIHYPFDVSYTRQDINKKQVVCGELTYDPRVKRFRLQGEHLNSALLAIGIDTSEGQGLTSYLNNNDDRFTVALDTSDVFYTAQQFYQIEYAYAESRLASLLIPVVKLGKVGSEKGGHAKRKRAWDTDSVFGVITNLRQEGIIPRGFGTPELLLCDDMGTEVADFVCVNFIDRKIAFIHAKHGSGRIVSASALHDVVAQAQKNLSVMPRGGAKPAHLERWNRDAYWKGTKIHRWVRGSKSLPTNKALWKKIRNDILDHPEGKKEVWLVVGKALNKNSLIDQLEHSQKRDSVTGQLVHLLSCLQAACIQLGVVLKVFCD